MICTNQGLCDHGEGYQNYLERWVFLEEPLSRSVEGRNISEGAFFGNIADRTEAFGEFAEPRHLDQRILGQFDPEEMTNDDWTIVSAIGTAAQAVAAALGLLFVGWQLMVARKTADLQALQNFAKEAREHEERLIAAPNEHLKAKAFNEFLNFLELNAAAFNDGLFPSTTKRLAKEKLRDSILIIRDAGEWHDKFESAVTTDTTFSELAEFMRSNRDYINKTPIRPA